MEDSRTISAPTSRPRSTTMNGARGEATTHRRGLGAALLVMTLVLLACGGPTSTVAQIPTATPTARPTATPMASVTPGASNVAFHLSGDGLDIQSLGPLTCLPHGIGYFVAGSDDLIVLATPQMTYDATTLQQMRNYLASPDQPLPSTLQLVQGTSTTAQVGQYQGAASLTQCAATLLITNTTTTPIQILQAGLRLDATPVTNPLTYRLIDTCSLVGLQYCLGSRGENTDCTWFGAWVQLASGASGTEELTYPVGRDAQGNGCGQLTIPGQANAHLTLNFGSAQPLAYLGAFEFKLEPQGEQEQTLVLSQVPTTLTFADPSQYVCYQLQGSTFTLGAQGNAALQGPVLDPQTGLWHSCV